MEILKEIENLRIVLKDNHIQEMKSLDELETKYRTLPISGGALLVDGDPVPGGDVK